MLQPLNWKDRILLAAILAWQTLYGVANFVLLSRVDQGAYSDPSITMLTKVVLVLSIIITGLGPIVMISLSLYQFRKTTNRFFALLLGANLLELLLPGFAMIYAFYPVLSLENTVSISYIQVYVMYSVWYTTLGLSLYAFATYDRPKEKWCGFLSKFKKVDLVFLSLATCVAAAYLLIPELYSKIPERFSIWSIARVLSLLTPVFLLWVALWQYRRTYNPFFRYFCRAFSLAVLAVLIGHSVWYLMGGTSYAHSLETAKTAARWNIGTTGLAAIINLCVLGFKAYALATYRAGSRQLDQFIIEIE